MKKVTYKKRLKIAILHRLNANGIFSLKGIKIEYHFYGWIHQDHLMLLNKKKKRLYKGRVG